MRVAPSGGCHHLWEAPGWRSVAKGLDDDDCDSDDCDDADVDDVDCDD